MENFNINRLTKYASAELNANKKHILTMLAAVVIISSTVYALIYITNRNFFIASAFTAFTTMVITAFSISACFKKYFNRSCCIETIMIPVSKAEKFTFNALFYTIISPLATLIVFAVISYGWALVYGFSTNFALLECQYIIEAILKMFTGASVFFFGAILFKRNHFIFTCLSIGAIISLMSFLIISIISNPDWAKYLMESTKDITFSLTATYITHLILILFFTTMSWIRFKKLQTA